MVHPLPPTATQGLADPEDDALDSAAAGEDAPERRSIRLGAELHGSRLDKAVVSIVPEFSRNYLQTLIEQGHVRIDGKPIDSPSRKVLAGQEMSVDLVPTPESRAFRAEAIPLSIVFEDEHLMVIDKPAGLVVHPAAGHWSGTLLNGILHHYPQAATLARAGIVHRLDKDTSGLMVVGKSLLAVTAFGRAIAAREVHREYLAIVNGRLRSEPFRVDAPMGRDPLSRVKMAVLGQGRPAQTDVTPLAVAELETGAVTAVRCKLHTGRTHQIRVHLAFKGHPLVSDPLYAGRPALGLQRQALHATKLGLAHPVTGEWMWFDAPPPADLAGAWEAVMQESGAD
ncbi:MAG: hypothetical protein RLZZ618_121 [Pseudomonadota bacterium]|jgi:23S rRNA pseudouridine1911/1915/1917 synthase